MNIFGFEIKKKPTASDTIPSFTEVEKNDGAVIIAAGGTQSTFVDIDGIVKTESDLVTKYRQAACHPEIDTAVDEVTNELIDIEADEPLTIDFDDNKIPEAIQKAVIEEYNEAERLLDFNQSCYDIIRRWYIDGRIKYHVVIDPKKPNEGIKELRYVDPRKLRKVREITQARGQKKSDGLLTKTVNEYYLYSERGFITPARQPMNNIQSLKISKDSIIDIPSGLTDINNKIVLSYLDKALRPLNQLRTLEDASVIYTLARAPERRVWYIDVGNLPKAKAEQQVQEMMKLHKNRLVYDQESGQIRDDRKFISMLEDYWLPRRGDSGRGTEVTTLPPGNSDISNMGQVDYFRKKLYRALNVPADRFDEESNYSLGRPSQITRDEVKFAKFIARLRVRFASLFLEVIRLNLILKRKITPEDWDQIKSYITFTWASNNYFDELKNSEILNDRLLNLQNIQPYIGIYYSKTYVKKEVLKQSDELIEQMQEEMDKDNIEMQNQDINNQILQQQIQQDGQPPEDDEEQDGQGAPTQGGSSNSQNDGSEEQSQIVYDKLKNKKTKLPHEEVAYSSAVQRLSKKSLGKKQAEK